MRSYFIGGLALALIAGSVSRFSPRDGQVHRQGHQRRGEVQLLRNGDITKTGENAWRVVSVIDGDKFDGYGIGDEDIIAVTFSGNGFQRRRALRGAGEWQLQGHLAFKGDSKVSAEELFPK